MAPFFDAKWTTSLSLFLVIRTYIPLADSSALRISCVFPLLQGSASSGSTNFLLGIEPYFMSQEFDLNFPYPVHLNSNMYSKPRLWECHLLRSQSRCFGFGSPFATDVKWGFGFGTKDRVFWIHCWKWCGRKWDLLERCRWRDGVKDFQKGVCYPVCRFGGLLLIHEERHFRSCFCSKSNVWVIGFDNGYKIFYYCIDFVDNKFACLGLYITQNRHFIIIASLWLASITAERNPLVETLNSLTHDLAAELWFRVTAFPSSKC